MSHEEFVAAYTQAVAAAGVMKRILAEIIDIRGGLVQRRYDPTYRVTPEFQAECKGVRRVLVEIYGPEDARWWLDHPARNKTRARRTK